jgi:hypothetical protein
LAILTTPIMNSHKDEFDNEQNSEVEVDNDQQRAGFLNVNDGTCESNDKNNNIVNIEETNKFNSLNSDEDNTSNLSAFINSTTRFKV